MIDILAISQASFMGINREIYRRIYKSNYAIELVVPKTLNYPTGIKSAEKRLPNDPPIHFLELKGTNPRVYQYTNLKKLLLLVMS